MPDDECLLILAVLREIMDLMTRLAARLDP